MNILLQGPCAQTLSFLLGEYPEEGSADNMVILLLRTTVLFPIEGTPFFHFCRSAQWLQFPHTFPNAYFVLGFFLFFFF